MNKVFLALCLFVVVAFAGKGSSCLNAIKVKMFEKYVASTTGLDRSAVWCEKYKYQPRGVWYRYVGENANVTFETCDDKTDFDTVIFVFDSCEEEQGFVHSCVAMDDDGCNYVQSHVSFFAKQNREYSIFVTGFMNSTGTFLLRTSKDPGSN